MRLRWWLVLIVSTAFPVASADAGAAPMWSLVPTARLDSGAQLASVSCTSPRSCMAVGRSYPQARLHALVERWNGTRWAAQPSPDPVGALYSQFSSVSCPQADFCMAVGNWTDSTNQVHPLAEAWDGVSWAIEPAPEPPGATDPALAGVSCRSSTRCVAVGGYRAILGTLAEAWNGSAWSVQTTANPAGGLYGYLYSVSCATDWSCIAVGSYTASSGLQYFATLAERLDHGTWTVQATPNAPGSQSDGFRGVACEAGGAPCYAVGGDNGGAGFRTLAARWDGVRWALQPSISGSDKASSLNSVSCTWPSGPCTAVGDIQASVDANVTLAERLSGGSWIRQATPNPPEPSLPVLRGISCPTSSRCVAVGDAGTFAPPEALSELYGL
jgi:hypothetical protein